MGTKPSTSVVDPRGRVWGTERLYIADAVSFAFLLSRRLSLTTCVTVGLPVVLRIQSYADRDGRISQHREIRPRRSRRSRAEGESSESIIPSLLSVIPFCR